MNPRGRPPHERYLKAAPVLREAKHTRFDMRHARKPQDQHEAALGGNGSLPYFSHVVRRFLWESTTTIKPVTLRGWEYRVGYWPLSWYYFSWPIATASLKVPPRPPPRARPNRSQTSTRKTSTASVIASPAISKPSPSVSVPAVFCSKCNMSLDVLSLYLRQ